MRLRATQLHPVQGGGAVPGRWLLARIGWRNLGRNRRRTWLTSGGIAFAVLLVAFFMAMQAGQYALMRENAASLLEGHIQLQARAYVDGNRFEDAFKAAGALQTLVEQVPGVLVVTPRVAAFALVSAGERSFGAEVLGIDAAAEARAVRFLSFIKEGRAPRNNGGSVDEAVVGRALARNLGVGLGSELVVLGSAREGGLAGLVLTVVGIFESGIAELDRSLLLAPIATVRAGFDLEDEAHSLVVRTADLAEAATVKRAIEGRLSDQGRTDVVVRLWDELLPEVRQAIEVDRMGGEVMYWIVMVLVAFSVVNSFIMTVFERRREFGMLIAIGMRPWAIMVLVQWEAFFMWLLGSGIGLIVAALLILWLGNVGIYLGEQVEALAAQFYMPTRMYPAFATRALLTAPLVMLIGTLAAALLPTLRIRRLRVADALRE